MGYRQSKMVRLLRYWFLHGIPTGCKSFRLAMINWMDLMWFTKNQVHYTLFGSDDPLEECMLFFWDSLEDNTVSMEVLEHIEEVMKSINDGTIELIPFDPGMFDSMDSDQ